MSYLFFWGHRKLDPGCLSQWWEASFEIDGVRYASAEHYMMAEKARLFGDEEVRRQILAAPTPADAKKLGRKVKNFDSSRWDRECMDIVIRGNYAKFSQNPELREFLLSTGSRELVEASPVDNIWGIGLAADDPRAQDPAQWQGENRLGKALMAVREQLR